MKNIDKMSQPELRSELKRARKLLCVAHCPNCAGEGMYCAEVPGYDGEPDYDMVECEFCAERSALLGEQG